LRGLNLVLAFSGVILVYCGLHVCQIKETSDSYFNCSIESETSSIIDLHVWFVCTGFRTNYEGPFNDFVLTNVSGAASSLLQRAFAFTNFNLAKVGSQKRNWAFGRGSLKRIRARFSGGRLSKAWFAKARPPIFIASA